MVYKVTARENLALQPARRYLSRRCERRRQLVSDSLCSWLPFRSQECHEVFYLVPFLARELCALSHSFYIAGDHTPASCLCFFFQIARRDEQRLVWHLIELRQLLEHIRRRLLREPRSSCDRYSFEIPVCRSTSRRLTLRPFTCRSRASSSPRRESILQPIKSQKSTYK